eukprot:scpid66537/ scgid30317/ Extended synaptotagmin-3
MGCLNSRSSRPAGQGTELEERQEPSLSQDAAFVNVLLAQLWPYFNSSLEQSVNEQLIPLMRRELKAAGRGLLKINTVSIGTKPLRIEGVQVYPKDDDATNITMDIDIVYDGDAEGSAELFLSFGIKNVSLRGRLRALLGPLGGRLPFSAISFFFMQAPKLDFDLTGAAGIADTPLTRPGLNYLINKYLSKAIVFPNRKSVIIDPTAGITTQELSRPSPRGVMSVTVVSVKDLEEKCDIFVNAIVREQTRTTGKVDDTKSAEFNETFDFALLEHDGVLVVFEVRDKDFIGSDSIGRAQVNLSDLTSAQEDGERMTLSLAGTKSGVIDVEFRWTPVLNKQTDFQVQGSASGQAAHDPERQPTIFLVSLAELRGVEAKAGEAYYAQVQLGAVRQDTLCAMSQTVHGERLLSFSDQLGFAVKPLSSAHNLVIDIYQDDDNDETNDSVFGTVAIPIADIPLKGAKQGNGDIILSLDGDVSDHQGVTLHVSIKQVNAGG